MNATYSCMFAVFNIEYMWITLHSHFENGMGRLKIQKVGYICSTLMLPVLSYLFVGYVPQWTMIVLANILALLPLCIMQPLYFRRTVQKFHTIFN